MYRTRFLSRTVDHSLLPASYPSAKSINELVEEARDELRVTLPRSFPRSALAQSHQKVLPIDGKSLITNVISLRTNLMSIDRACGKDRTEVPNVLA